MSHYAKIEDGKVVQVIVSTYDFIQTLPGKWLRTSYNMKEGKHARGLKPLRKNFAGVGYTYNKELDAFIPPSPYPSWILNTERGVYEAPEPKPNVPGRREVWNEEVQDWLDEGELR